MRFNNYHMWIQKTKLVKKTEQKKSGMNHSDVWHTHTQNCTYTHGQRLCEENDVTHHKREIIEKIEDDRPTRKINKNKENFTF